MAQNNQASNQRQAQAEQLSQGQSGFSPPAISLPKGGGAIRGIGEKFAANPVTGTGSMSVPIAVNPGRSGFGPELSLSYDSGAGNGPFGFGWNLSLPSVTRKTDKGLPQYRDGGRNQPESDVLILSGAEDLVPVLTKNSHGDWEIKDLDSPDGDYLIRRYRPRIDGLFARIERWTKIAASDDVHWRSISKDNILTLYGKDTNSRIADPENPERIFSWLICETHDDKGNAVIYKYKSEDGAGVDLGKAHERNRGDRGDTRRTANCYLKRIYYGNRKPLLDEVTEKRPRQLTDEQIKDAGWMFEVVLDYGEHDVDAPKPDDAGEWDYRNDPFSSYRAGFEVRTTRLCQRVLMFHHIPDLPTGEEGYDGLVRSTDFTYSYEQDPSSARNPVYAFLQAVTQTGYKRKDGGYLKRSLPPLEFEYSQPTVQDTIEYVDKESLENLPIGVDSTAYQWTDLHGEGIPGILSEQGSAWYYKRNLSPISTEPGSAMMHTKFAPVERVALQPNLALAGGAQFMDLAGDGQPDLVVLDGPMPGLYEHDGGEGWQPFRPFTFCLKRDTHDPNLKFVDLNGDGHADILVTENNAFVWYPSLAEAGFGPDQRVAQALDEEKGPCLVFADGTQSIYLADMSGDGLPDLVRLQNGEVCYWPNLGYARFGAKVTMDHSPNFDNPDQFDQKRIRLADIDGSGTTDIIYLHRDGVRLYFNQSGNSWSEPQVLNVFPHIDNLVTITPTDLLGNGTACLVWSSPLPSDIGRQMRYVNLMGEQKPHLLCKVTNNLGAETCIQYAPSTKFYLKDKYDGHPWITRLPFLVHVVERVETYDHISRNRFVTRYAYHHGYFDGDEREFRGFGRVDQWDTEEYASLEEDGLLEDTTNFDAASHVPPVLTKTWFHTGVYLGRDRVSRSFAGEYYREPALRITGPDDPDKENKAALFAAQLLSDTLLPPDLTLEEEREACRALKGAMLRQEVYALDKTDKAEHPYTVTEQNFTIKRVQPEADNRHGVFFTHAREAITYHFERNPDDPRVSHALTLEVDDFGNVLKQVAIGYGRRQSPLPEERDRKKQITTLITYTENRFTVPQDHAGPEESSMAIDTTDDYRTPMPCETRTYELRQEPSVGRQIARLMFDDVLAMVAQAEIEGHDIYYEDLEFDGAKNAIATHPEWSEHYFRRLIEHMRTRYRPNDLGKNPSNDPSTLLELGKLESLALPGESYTLAFTDGLLSQVFKRGDQHLLHPNLGNVLSGQGPDQGGYVDLDSNGNWWIPSGRVFYHPDAASLAADEWTEARTHFFLPRRFRDPFGQKTTVDYDGHDLLTVKTEDALKNVVTARTEDDDNKIAIRNDYRVLQPYWVTDPNGNRTRVAFDALGLVVGTALMGKPGEDLGDSLKDFEADLTQDRIDDFYDVEDPHVPAPDLLRDATTRIIYDVKRFLRTQQENPDAPSQWLPTYAVTLAREAHAGDPVPPDGLKIQISFSYSDGFGREIQKKIQAEPGPVEGLGENADPRWVGSGWTVFNNKGKPVRQYEPFFSQLSEKRHRFEFGVRVGVSPVLFYDPVGRVICTLHPNHTYEKVVFDPWQQATYDVNDTLHPTQRYDPRFPDVLPDHTFDPAKDPNVGEYFERLPQDAYEPTWYDLRMDSAKAIERWPDVDIRAAEKSAAEKAAKHAATPTVAHFDVLGRPFLTIADNGADENGDPQEFKTRVELDIEGNQRAVTDAKGRVVMRYDYAIVGPSQNKDDAAANRIHQASMEAGERWTLNDVTGKPIRTWDSRGHNFTTEYDGLRRPVRRFVQGTDNTPNHSDPRTVKPKPLLIEEIEYGEGQNEDKTLNLRTRVFRHCDSAGIITNMAVNSITGKDEAYDFKGNLLRSSRQLVKDYEGIPDWSGSPKLEDEIFTSSTTYDALNRPIQVIAPHSSQSGTKLNVIQPVYNEANLLERVNVWLDQTAEPSEVLDPDVTSPSAVGVDNIDYDAKSQRLRIDYRNGTSTFYDYDPETFRLVHLYTRRGPAFTKDCGNEPPPPKFAAPDMPPPTDTTCGLQNMHYTYDPVGNITHIRDEAQQTIFFSNKRVEPSAEYTYDALYRLIEARGREHLGQVGGTPIPHSYNDARRIRRPHPNSGEAMSTYTECYVYDEVGNFRQIRHIGNEPANDGWTRHYDYLEKSLLENGVMSNRLTATTVGSHPAEQYSNDGDGYDAHGNMLRMPQLTVMQWDYQDQLQMTQRQKVNDEDAEGIERDGERTYYAYDANGQRVHKVTEKDDKLKEERIYLGSFEIYRKHVGDYAGLERETLHIMDDKQRIALVETRNDVDDKTPKQLIRHQLGNHLGSACLELDAEAHIISYEEYTPYGSTSYQAVRSGTEVPKKRYRYTGKERDEGSGFYYYGARYYVAWLGRWCNCDPRDLADAPNLYIHVRNNPTTSFDPDGRQTSGNVLALGLFKREFEGVPYRIKEESLAYDAEQAVPGTRGKLIKDLPGFAETLKAAKGEAVASRIYVSEALAGEYGITDIYFDLEGMDSLKPRRVDGNVIKCHTLSELDEVVNYLKKPGTGNVRVHFKSAKGLSTLTPGSTNVEGADLPQFLQEELGSFYQGSTNTSAMAGKKSGLSNTKIITSSREYAKSKAKTPTLKKTKIPKSGIFTEMAVDLAADFIIVSVGTQLMFEIGERTGLTDYIGNKLYNYWFNKSENPPPASPAEALSKFTGVPPMYMYGF